MMNRQRNSRHRSQRTRQSGRLVSTDIRPRQILSNPEMQKTFRFTCPATIGRQSVSVYGLIGMAGTICTATNTTAYPFFNSVRIKKIEMWAGIPSSASQATVACEWESGYSTANNREVVDTTTSPSYPAHIVAIPPPQSLVSFWQQPANNLMCYLSGPAGTIIDVTVALVAYDDQGANTPFSVATAAVGNVYYLYLDYPNHAIVPLTLTSTY